MKTSVNVLIRRMFAFTFITFCSVLIAGGLAEVLVRGYQAILDHRNPWIHRACGTCKEMYELVPGASDINSSGFRGPQIRSGAAKRIIFVGDSVTFGLGVSEDETFPAKIRRRLKDTSVEVINAGVSGYSTYNERFLISERLLALRPKQIILQICLNDIADPRYHLNSVARLEIDVPLEAIPNPEEIQKFAHLPQVRLSSMSWLRWSAIFRQLRLLAYQRQFHSLVKHVGVVQRGRFWPTYITGELPLDLSPWRNPGSKEFLWFRDNLRAIHETLSREGIDLQIVFIPLAYQLDPAYPFQPYATIASLANELGIRSLDLTPALQGSTAEESYLAAGKDVIDTWHLSSKGHSLVAEVVRQQLIEPKKSNQSNAR